MLVLASYFERHYEDSSPVQTEALFFPTEASPVQTEALFFTTEASPVQTEALFFTTEASIIAATAASPSQSNIGLQPSVKVSAEPAYSLGQSTQGAVEEEDRQPPVEGEEGLEQ